MRVSAQPWIALGRTLILLAFICGVLGAPGSARPPVRDTTYQDTRGEGKELVREMLMLMPAENSRILGLLKIRPSEGGMKEVPVRMTVRVSENGWEDIYETQPVGSQPGEVFVVKHRGLKPNEYRYGTYGEVSEKPERNLESSELYQALGGSDFYLADLGLEFLHWPSQKIVKKEMRKSRSCRVVESINPNPRPGAYSRVLSWVDFETSGIILAEAYDHNDRLLKEFSIRGWDRKERRVKEMEIRNDQTDSRTRLVLNVEVEVQQPAR